MLGKQQSAGSYIAGSIDYSCAPVFLKTKQTGPSKHTGPFYTFSIGSVHVLKKAEVMM